MSSFHLKVAIGIDRYTNGIIIIIIISLLSRWACMLTQVQYRYMLLLILFVLHFYKYLYDFQ